MRMSKRTWSALVGATAATAFALSAALPAAAASTEPDLLWYYNVPGYEAIHGSGITGEGVTIAVIDGPINVEVPTLQGADVRVQESTCLDESGGPYPMSSTDFDLADHGTSVTSLLVGTGAGYPGQTGVKGVAPGATVLFYGVYIETEGGPLCHSSLLDSSLNDGVRDATALAIERAVASGADIISISMITGEGRRMRAALKEAILAGVIIVAGLANAIGPDQPYDGPPATLRGVVSVLGAQRTGELSPRLNPFSGDIIGPNDSEYVVVVAPGWEILTQGKHGDGLQQGPAYGTSLATPIVAGNLALAMQKYPQATGNQILQSMIHNTGTGESHEPVWEPMFGFGIVVPRTLLAADPTQYPDVNALVKWFSPQLRFPTLEEMFPNGYPPPQQPAAAPSSSTTPAPGDSPAPVCNVVVIAIIGGIGLLVLLLVGAITAVAVTRKRDS